MAEIYRIFLSGNIENIFYINIFDVISFTIGYADVLTIGILRNTTNIYDEEYPVCIANVTDVRQRDLF